MIENWAIVSRPCDPYTAPEDAPKAISGRVYGHTRFEDGEDITTSRIMRIDVGADDVIMVTTSNNVYQLVEVDPAYEAAYPDAKQRLIRAVRKQ